jgi:Flp pilus assembly protein TadD
MRESKLIAAGLLFCALGACAADLAAQTRRRHRVPVEGNGIAPKVAEAEAAMEKRDYTTAEKLLREAVIADGKDHRAWFDLGYVLTATDRRDEAIAAYRSSVAAKPDVFESNLNLGLLLAAAGHADAERFLRAATGLKPSAQSEQGTARAWLSLGRLIQEKDPAGAADAFRQAAELTPKDPEPQLSLGLALEKQGDLAGAEQAFRAAAELAPGSSEPLAGLIGVYIRAKRLDEAEAALKRYLAQDPANRNARLQLARLHAARGRHAEALREYESIFSGKPPDAEHLRDLAALYAVAENWPKASEYYGALAQQEPRNAEIRHSLGRALLKQRQFEEALPHLAAAVDLKPDNVDAYGDLAIAASESKRYALAIKALDARARYAPETPATYFLRATAYDHLKAFKDAAVHYRNFLAAAKGQFPDQEWQARHRLLAIEPRK